MADCLAWRATCWTLLTRQGAGLLVTVLAGWLRSRGQPAADYCLAFRK
jgi:hypothetical protein